MYWTERRGRGIFLRASPIDVSGLLEDKLFDKVDTVVLTSATLSSAGNFSFIRERLGLSAADDLIAESIFDFQIQALLYLPPRMPDPRARMGRGGGSGSCEDSECDRRPRVCAVNQLAGMQAL